MIARGAQRHLDGVPGALPLGLDPVPRPNRTPKMRAARATVTTAARMARELVARDFTNRIPRTSVWRRRSGAVALIYQPATQIEPRRQTW